MQTCGYFFPSGVIVNRLLDRKGEVTHIAKLEDFFGLTEEEIRRRFYHTDNQNSLFADSDISKTEKMPHAIEKIAEIYIERLHELFKCVVQKPLVLRNTRNVPIYHFVFASQKEVAMKIAKDIVAKE